MTSKIRSLVMNSPSRIPMLIGVYAGLEITGASVKDVVCDSAKQVDAILALHERFQTQLLLTAMDLSVEAEAFGCQIKMSDGEIPTVIGKLATGADQIDGLIVPGVGEKRTRVQLETARALVAQATGHPVLGGLIGPFSLAGRLIGVSEALELSLTDADLLERLLVKVTGFLTDYARAFRAVKADGVIMAEPAAGLLSPRGLGRFSSKYVNQIVEESQGDDFSVIYHNCGAKLIHLPEILKTGAEVFHFGAPMDLGRALTQVDENILLAGNLDPARIFRGGTAAEVIEATQNLLNIAAGHKNFIISSGCDIPPFTPAENLQAFYATVRGM